jgi:hypothetical protein
VGAFPPRQVFASLGMVQHLAYRIDRWQRLELQISGSLPQQLREMSIVDFRHGVDDDSIDGDVDLAPGAFDQLPGLEYGQLFGQGHRQQQRALAIVDQGFDLTLDLKLGSPSASGDLKATSPIIGLRTFWDLDEHWNLSIEGDYGGFGMNDSYNSWQAVGLIGYRLPLWGAHWNL